MNDRSSLRYWLSSLVLIALFARPGLAGNLCFLSPDATKQVEVGMMREGNPTEGYMEISYVAIGQTGSRGGAPLVIDKVQTKDSQPAPCISWSPDSRYVVVDLSYKTYNLLRIFGFQDDKPFEVDTSVIHKAFLHLNKKPVAVNKGMDPGTGFIYHMNVHHVAWTKDSRLAVRHDGMNKGRNNFSVGLLFDPETAQASEWKLNDVEQKQPTPPAKAAPAAPPARTGFWRIFKH